MKTQNTKHKIKFLIPMLLLVFAGSCKKEKIEDPRPKTVADFEKIMATDLSIQSIVASTNKLINLEPPISLITTESINNNNKKSRQSITSDELSAIAKSVKNKDDLSVIFKEKGIENYEEKINLLNEQSKALISFLKDYPEFGKLERSDIDNLLKLVIKRTNLNSSPPSSSSITKNLSSSIMFAADCAQTWAKTINRCEIAYSLALIAIWGEVAVASAFTVGFAAAPAIATAFVQTGVAYLANEFCIDWATEDFFDCI